GVHRFLPDELADESLEDLINVPVYVGLPPVLRILEAILAKVVRHIAHPGNHPAPLAGAPPNAKVSPAVTPLQHAVARAAVELADSRFSLHPEGVILRH